MSTIAHKQAVLVYNTLADAYNLETRTAPRVLLELLGAPLAVAPHGLTEDYFTQQQRARAAEFLRRVADALEKPE